MRKIIIGAMSLALVAGVALAAEPTAAPAAAPAAKAASCPKGKKAPKTTTCKGAIEAIDAAAGTLSVKNEKGEVMAFKVVADSKVTVNGKKAALADLAVGQDVQVKYCGEGESMAVKSVAVKIKKAKKEKKAEAAK